MRACALASLRSMSESWGDWSSTKAAARRASASDASVDQATTFQKAWGMPTPR